VALRARSVDLQAGRYETMAAPDGVWAWRRGDHTVVALNMSEADVACDAGPGRIGVGTDRARDGEQVGAVLRLGPWEGVVVETP
jgi:hypothetical protein